MPIQHSSCHVNYTHRTANQRGDLGGCIGEKHNFMSLCVGTDLKQGFLGCGNTD